MLRTCCLAMFRIVAVFAIFESSGLHADDFDPFNNPDPFVTSYLTDNRGKINNLIAVSEDKSRSATVRIEALKSLHKVLPDVALPTLAKLIQDESVEVASQAASMLAAASMMMNHKMPEANLGDHKDNPSVEYGMARHELIFASLLKLLDDSRPKVRALAAQSLSANSDKDGVTKIIEDTNSGRYSEQEAISYLTLAGPELVGEFLSKYLDSKDAKLLTPVSQYLAESRFRGQVRDKVLWNRDAPIEARQESSRLMPTDDLVPLFVSPDTPEVLYSSALDEYVKRQGSKLTKPQVELLLQGIKKFDPAASATTKEIKEKLEGYIKNFEKNK